MESPKDRQPLFERLKNGMEQAELGHRNKMTLLPTSAIVRAGTD